jgi:hypothetical protein
MSIEMKVSRKTAESTLFDHKRKWRDFGRGDNITSWWEAEKTQIKLATTYNKNEQQENYKNNAEL